MAKKKSELSKGLEAVKNAAREYFEPLNELETLFAEFEELIEDENISAIDRRRFRNELRFFRQLLIVGPRHPLAQKLERRFRPAPVRKPSTRSYKDFKATELQQRDLAKKCKRENRNDLERKALRRAEQAHRDAEIALKDGR